MNLCPTEPVHPRTPHFFFGAAEPILVRFVEIKLVDEKRNAERTKIIFLRSHETRVMKTFGVSAMRLRAVECAA